MERLKQCHSCTSKCPQEELACEIAKGRMYAANEIIRLQKEVEEYRSLEEQGLLLRLKLKVGDKVWEAEFGKVIGYEITAYSFGTAEDYIYDPVTETEVVYYYTNSSGSITGSFAESEIGKTMFLTRKEAEAVLEQMKGGAE